MIPFGPHAGQPLLRSGPPVDKAANAVIAIHGRGANASDIISIAKTLKVPDTAWLAPEAAAHTWYPYSFLNPVEQNQPFLDSAISIVGGLLQHLQDSGMPLERAVLLGFSQGACLASEFVARYPRRYGGVVIFSGGLIGEQIDPASFQGSLEQTPIFGGCSDSDPHIRWSSSRSPGRSRARWGRRRLPGLRNGTHHQHRGTDRRARPDRAARRGLTQLHLTRARAKLPFPVHGMGNFD
ncbi:MAG: alpha/beta hydrolase [Thermomicrobiales bacterium]|nr:alpha/beta hydrolase [Thermomicrobiales bacterium]